MNASNVLVLALQTGFVLVATLAAGLVLRRAPALRLAIYRISIVGVFALLLGSPWLHERPHPVIPVRWEPAPMAAAAPSVGHATGKSGAGPSSSPSYSAAPSFEPLAAGTVVWALGAAFLVAHLGLGYLSLRRVRSGCRPVRNGRVLQILGQICRQAGVSVSAIVEGEAVGNPFVAGARRPTVFLPLGWAESVDDEALEAVLRHEVAHIANGDLRWGLAHRLACIALWPQPLLWLLRRPMSAASEELCDRHVLASGIPNARYAECLLSLRENRLARPCPSLGIGAVCARSALGKRVEAILDGRRSHALKLSRFVSASLKVGGLVLAGCAVVLFAKPADLQGMAQDPFAGWTVKPYAGRVRILSADGKPVTGAKAWLTFSGDVPESSSQRLTVEGADAILPNDLKPLQPRATLVVQAPGYGLGFVPTWPAPKPVTEIRLPSAVSVEGRLLLPNGSPAAGVQLSAKLFVRRGNGPMPFEALQVDPAMGLDLSATTDTGGAFRFEGLPPRTSLGYDVDDERFAQLRFAARAETGSSGTTTAKPVTLELAAAISGRVTRNGKPVAGLFVGSQGNHERDRNDADLSGRALTDKDGRYTMGRLPAGVYNVMPDLRGPLAEEVTAVAHEAVTLTAGHRETRVDFDLIPGVVVDGRVVDQAGKPMAQVFVGVYGPAHPMSSAWVQAVHTDKDGRYRFRVPAGKQHIYLADARYEPDARDIVVTEATTVNLTARPARER